MTILIPILGDQLSLDTASLRDVAPGDAVVLLMEVAEETLYVRHHKRKIALVLSAMRHFAAELRDAGWTVNYVRLDDRDNSGSFTGEVTRAIARHRPAHIRIVEPGEWRVKAMIDDGTSASIFLSRFSPMAGSFVASSSSRPGRRRGATSSWNISIARCAAGPGC